MKLSLVKGRPRKCTLHFKHVIYILTVSCSTYLYFIYNQTVKYTILSQTLESLEANQNRKLSIYLPVIVDDDLKEYDEISNNKDRDITPHLHTERLRTENIIMRTSKDQLASEGNHLSVRSNISKPLGIKHKIKRLPHAIIIGVKKCGTRALLEYLRLHPDVKAPGPEPHFFDKFYHKGLDWYRERMPNSYDWQITIEKTPRYFVNPDVPYRVWKMANTTKLLLVVRNPVTRAISDFTQGASKQHCLTASAFMRKAFRANGTGAVNTHWSIINTGLYSLHLRRWLRYFPLNQIYIVSGERLISNPALEMEGVQMFLGLKIAVSERDFYFNATKGFPCLNRKDRGWSTRCFNRSKGRQHLQLNKTVIDKLKSFYKPYNNEFYKLTNRFYQW